MILLVFSNIYADFIHFGLGNFEENLDNYKLIDALKTMSSKELRRFGEFVSSPYFNKNENVIALFETLADYHPKYQNKNLTIEKVFTKVFSHEKFDYHKINNVISDTFRLYEKYLAQAHIESREYYIERNIFRKLRDKKLFRIYEQKHTAYIKELINRKHKDEDYYYYLYEINDEYLWYATIKKPNTELNILQTEFDYFFSYALIRLLRFYNLMLHEQNQNNVKYELTMMEEIMNFVWEKNFNSSAINVFKTILLLLKTKDEKYYRQLWELKAKHFNDFRSDDQLLIFIHLYDYAAYMVNFKGNDEFNKDMFEIYKEMIEIGMLTPQHYHYPDFMNIVKIACRVREYDYAEKVLKDFEPSLPAAEKEDIMAFCRGTIAFSKGNLKDALRYFSKANFQNFIFKVQVKILLLKSYYKLGMYEETLGIIDTFKHFVSREENLLEEHKQSYTMFLNLMTELIKAKSGHRDEKDYLFSKIRKNAETMPANPFRVKVWLLDELNKK